MCASFFGRIYKAFSGICACPLFSPLALAQSWCISQLHLARFTFRTVNENWWTAMTANTTVPSYWLNWRFYLCAVWIAVAMVFASLMIWRGCKKSRNQLNGNQKELAGSLYGGESWATCWKSIRPVWLLAFRVVAFCALLALLIADAAYHSVGIFYFYTQWTFTLVTVYFGLASSLSIYGYLHHKSGTGSETNQCIGTDTERGSYVAPTLGENSDIPRINESLNNYDGSYKRDASNWEYALQIIFQMCGGAVVLTDSVFWLIIYPFLTDKDYKLHFLVVCLHSVNAVFLLGETTMNSLRFPFYRIAYFILWTCIYVVFQWIIHACVSMKWPYTFLDLSSNYAPIWYVAVGLMHFPCFGIFLLVFKIKQRCLSG